MCHQYLASNPGRVITRYQFSELLNKAWMQSKTIANMCTAFRKTGVYPINRAVFSTSDDPPLLKESGLAFIPLYSPISRHRQLQDHDGLIQECHSDETQDEMQKAACSPVIPECRDCESVWMQPPKCCSVSELLKYLSPVYKTIEHQPKSLLTSTENLATLEQKEQVKKEKEILKQERKRVREKKRIREEKKAAQGKEIHVLI